MQGMQGELKLTVLVTWETGKGIIHSHVAALPSRPKPPVKVQVDLWLSRPDHLALGTCLVTSVVLMAMAAHNTVVQQLCMLCLALGHVCPFPVEWLAVTYPHMHSASIVQYGRIRVHAVTMQYRDDVKLSKSNGPCLSLPCFSILLYCTYKSSVVHL